AHVARGLYQPALEVVEPLWRNPWVVPGKRLDPLLVDLGREKLGERRRAGLLPRLAAAERDIRLADEPHRRQHVALVLHLLARDAERNAEPDPELDPTRSWLGTVVVDDPSNPLPPHIGVGAVRQDRGVLAGYDSLIREAVGHPALELALAELALVHEPVKRVLDVVRPVERAQGLLELCRRERTLEDRDRRPGWGGELRGGERGRHGRSQRVNRMPSAPIRR